jgi:1-deoxy-D-xylulose-5-phosphate synthase
MVSAASKACSLLKERGIDAGLVPIGQVKPLEQKELLERIGQVPHIVTLEDNTVIGGFGQMLRSLAADKGGRDVIISTIGWPDKFIEHGSVDELFEKYGLNPEGLAERIQKIIEG